MNIQNAQTFENAIERMKGSKEKRMRQLIDEVAVASEVKRKFGVDQKQRKVSVESKRWKTKTIDNHLETQLEMVKLEMMSAKKNTRFHSQSLDLRQTPLEKDNKSRKSKKNMGSAFGL